MLEYAYTGDGTTFFSGIPARTLSQEEWDTIPSDLKAALLESGLYVAEAVAEEEPNVTD